MRLQPDDNPRPWGHYGLGLPNHSTLRAGYRKKVSHSLLLTLSIVSVTASWEKTVRLFNSLRAFIGESAQTLKCAGVNARNLVGSSSLSKLA